jgi:hypothetical protein
MTVRVVICLVALLLAACRGLDDPGGRVGVFFPRYGSMGPTPLAVTDGRLEVKDGCVWLVRTVGTKIVPIWPAGYGLRGTVGALQVTDSSGRVVAAEGQSVRVVGGEYAVADARRLMGQEEPAACGGSGFWLVGSVIARAERSSIP